MSVQVDFFGYGVTFYLAAGQQGTWWFGTPFYLGWDPGRYGAVSPVLRPDSDNGPLQVLAQAVERLDLGGNPEFPQLAVVRLATFGNPTSNAITFNVWGVEAPGR